MDIISADIRPVLLEIVLTQVVLWRATLGD